MAGFTAIGPRGIEFKPRCRDFGAANSGLVRITSCPIASYCSIPNH
jgi:hypothetical protein